eukprot:XP_014008184.1 PREDICTED: protein diaphanous homolog 3-like [Salmo salar]
MSTVRGCVARSGRGFNSQLIYDIDETSLIKLPGMVGLTWVELNFSQQQNRGSVCSSHQISPQEFLVELKSGVTEERLMACLDSLRVSLTSNPVSWVQSFGHEGLGLLLDILEKLLHKKHQDKPDKKSQHKVIQCLKAFMNNKYGLERILGEEKCLSLLARAIDPTQPAMMTDVVKLLSAICIVGEENTLEKVLEAITTAGEHRATERFSPIVEGLRDRSVQLQPEVRPIQADSSLWRGEKALSERGERRGGAGGRGTGEKEGRGEGGGENKAGGEKNM